MSPENLFWLLVCGSAGLAIGLVFLGVTLGVAYIFASAIVRRLVR